MEKYTYALGRRKTSVATVRLFKGKGENTVNEKKITAIYTSTAHQDKLQQPFVLTKTYGEYYFTAKTVGGGKVSQLEAIVLGIARGLIKEDASFKTVLKQAKLLTRDPRMVERKKTGLRKARRAPQYSKR